MSLLKITDLTAKLGLTSRSLRYYEQVGLIKSIRPEFEKYRYYDADAIERLKQIIVLRKMQIPIRDIQRIYESKSMSVVVEAFVNRIHAIDDEIGALAELKRIIGEFLQTMLQNGISKISALPLLYEEMDKQLALMDEHKPVTADDLNAVSERLAKPLDISIVDLPPMRVLSSYLKASPLTTDTEGFRRFEQASGILPGSHERFEFQADAGDVMILRIPDDYVNESAYTDYSFAGGLFAAANVYLDDDLGERFRSIVKDFDVNKYYQVDYALSGGLRHAAMIENLISPDGQRDLVSLLVPVKKRMADPSLFEQPDEISPGSISLAEIESQNPVLWMVDVPLGKLTQTHVNNSYFKINEDGEAEYIGWIIRAVLKTNVPVKLPFRVDLEFRQSGEGGAGIVIYHGEDTGYHTGYDLGNMGFGINMGNNANQNIQAINFHQPVFWDYFNFPGRGAVKTGEQNHLSWIIGKKHLAVIINGEIRYCGVNFPYMSLDLSREPARPIVIGTHGGNDMKYFRSIRISQLAETQKSKLKEGELNMITKQSNNIIPTIHRLVTDEYGENYWFNGCAKYVMESIGEPQFDYWFFAGLTGDVFTQHYSFTEYSADAISRYMMDEKPAAYIEGIFSKCGYAATFIPDQEIRKNTALYLNTLMAYIDKGIPVFAWGCPESVLVGYEDYGKVLLSITGNNNQPERIPLDKALQSHDEPGGWIFVGEKKESRPLARIYRDAISEIPCHFRVKTDAYCFGPEAFRAWARDIDNGKYDGMSRDEFKIWEYYTDYVCVLATNGSCCHEFLKRARELNPDMGFLEEVSRLYRRTADIWNNDHGEDLEALGGGFNITLEVLQDKDKRTKITDRIRECASVMDEVIKILDVNIN